MDTKVEIEVGIEPAIELSHPSITATGCANSEEGSGEAWIADLFLWVWDQSEPGRKAHQVVRSSLSPAHTAPWKRLRNLEINMRENRNPSHSARNTTQRGHVPEKMILLSRNFSHVKCSLLSATLFFNNLRQPRRGNDFSFHREEPL